MDPRILLIEDNASDVELVRTAFAEVGVGCELTVCSDGETAVANVQALAAGTAGPVPALILLDLNLPRVSGHQVLAAIRAQPVLNAIPVVVLSTSNHGDDRRRCLAGGASDYLVKPPRFHELLDLVNTVAQRWLGGTSPSAPQSPQSPPDDPQRRAGTG